MGDELNFNVQGGNIGNISKVWWREITKPILQGPNVRDGKNSLVLSIRLNTKMVKNNINTQGVERNLPLMFGLEHELEHFYKNKNLKIQNTSLVVEVCKLC